MPDPPAPAAPVPAGTARVAVPAAPTRIGLARFRIFSADAERLALDWAQYPEAPLPWVMDPAIPARPGVEGGFWVSAPPYSGYAKPLNPQKADPRAHPVAALEKIASDLAYQLTLCIPPVTLWERANAPVREPRHHSVSAPPFARVVPWGEICSDAALYANVKPLAVPAMSAMLAFDTWLGCEDHVNNPGNLLLTTEPGPPLRAYLAFIDYAYSMTHKWRQHGYRSVAVVQMYDPSLSADVAVVREAVDAVTRVSDVFIQSTVGRIPDPYLSSGDKNLIIDGLLYRRDNLRQFLAGAYPGIQ